MKLHETLQIFIILALTTLSVSCSQNDTSQTDVSPNTQKSEANNSPASPLRNSEEELSYIKEKAKSLNQNEQGYWEADFGGGHIFIYVPSAIFTMGNNKLSAEIVTGAYPSSPEHQITLDHYWIAKTPVTIGQFKEFVQATGYVTDVEKPDSEGPYVYDLQSRSFEPKQGYNWQNAFKDLLAKHEELKIDDTHPATCLSWNDAIAYSNWLAQKTGLPITLPTDAEYEYASRGSDGRLYPWGNDDPDGTKANYADESFNRYFADLEQSIVHSGSNDGYVLTAPVGSFPNGASPFGALDMVGNINQWVYDSEYEYSAQAKTNPITITNSSIKMQRSGDWSSSAGRANQSPDELAEGHNIRAEMRSGDDKSSADDHLGFRIAISYTPRN